MSTRCPQPGDCTPPAPLVPVYNDGEYCSEVTADRCVVHTGDTLANIGALNGTKLSTILTNINNLLTPASGTTQVIYNSREEILSAIAPADREQAVLLPVREGDLITFYWFQGGTGDVNLVPYETSLKLADALLLAGTTLDDAGQKMTLDGTRWRLNDTEFSITTPVPFNIPAPDAGGLLRIDNIVGDFAGNVIYQTGTPGLNATAPDVAYKNILITTIYVSNDGLVEVDAPVYVPEGGVLFNFGDPSALLGKEGNSYINQANGQVWKKEGEVAVWNLKYTPVQPIGPLVDGRVTLSSGTNTVTDSPALLFDRTTNQFKVNTTSTNSNYKMLVAGGFTLLSGILNMDEYYSQLLMSGGRTAILADGNGMKFRLFNNDNADFPDTSKSFSFYNKGFEHMRLFSDATSLNGSGQPLSWEFKTRLNYRLYLTHTAQNTGGAYRVLVRNSSTNEVESVDPTTLAPPAAAATKFGVEDNTATADRNFANGAYRFSISGQNTNVSYGVWSITNTNNLGIGLSVFANGGEAIRTETGGTGIYATSTGQGRGVHGRVLGSVGVGVYGEANEATPGYFLSNSGNTNGLKTILVLNRQCQLNPLPGMGGSIDFNIEGSDHISWGSNQLISRWNSIGPYFESEFLITGSQGNPTPVLQSVFGVLGTGKARLHRYGVGSFTGTATRNLSVDLNGNIIETAIPAAGGGSTTTADNGLTKTADNLQWGGTLLHNTIIDGGIYNTAFNANFFGTTLNVSNAHSNGQGIYSSGGIRGINGFSDGGVGVQGNSNFSFGINGISTNSAGVAGTSTAGKGGQFVNDNTAVNTVTDVLGVYRKVSGATDGIGAALVFGVATSTGSAFTTNANKFISKWTTADHATRTSEFSILGVLAGVEATKFTIKGNGTINITTPPQDLADNAAALAAGLVAGDIYRTGDFMKIVH